jgi:hypothetical protein
MISKDTKKQLMKFYVRNKLPEFCEAVSSARTNKIEKKQDTFVILHQDAFAGDYQEDEFYLLGCAIKYAGEYGVEVRIIGNNQETIN